MSLIYLVQYLSTKNVNRKQNNHVQWCPYMYQQHTFIINRKVLYNCISDMIIEKYISM